MRERLVAAFVGLTILVVALYGIPRAYVLADLVRDQQQERLDRTTELVAETVAERRAAHGKVDSAYLDGLADEGEAIIVWSPSGKATRTTGYTDPSGTDISSTVKVGGRTVIMTLDGDRIGSEISSAILPLVLLGLFLVLLAGAVGYLVAARIARSFQQLATAARGLGTGQLHPKLPSYRIPEAREISQALAASGDKLDALLAHERELTVHASHELRTPVTALRLELEDLALWPETDPAVAEQLQRSVAELDRLSDAIGELLSTSQHLSATAEIDLDLDALVADTVARLVARGHHVAHAPVGSIPTRLDPQPVVAALELLLPHADHVTELVRPSYLEVRITGADLERLVSRGQAADLVAAAGGQLTTTDTGVLLRLPRRPVTVR
ncbi:histidine kinase dimerization/phospho-acceptor domain-containing protein [Nocardioides sp. MH1]|uniref:histidine kinase dimerization/phospho-acceptor domain-containing protein n=1 Tax=Nocardioides sp. MH1 TaxID=3242490 RepID=UPI0035229FF1